MDIRKIKKLIELLEETGIAEIEIKEGEESLRLSRYSHVSEAIPQVKHITMPHTAPTTTTSPSNPHHTATNEPKTPEQPTATGHKIRAPMVGTMYTASSPDTPPFVNIGQSVKPGDTLCIIEAMKMFNEIEADRAGVVVAIHAVNGEPVEFDQPLFTIE